MRKVLNHTAFALFSTALLLLGGCKLFGVKSSSNSGQSGGAFLTQADVTPGAVMTTDATSIVSDLAQETALYDHQPPTAADTSDATLTACQTALDSARLQATKDTVTYDVTVDFTACAGNQPSVRYVASTPTRMSMKWTCSGGDVSSYNGKTTKDTPTLDLSSCQAGTFTWQTKGTLSWIATGTSGGTYSSLSVGFFGTPDLQACSYTVDSAGVHYQNGCIDVNKNDTTVAPATTPDEFYSKYTYNGLTRAPDSAKAVWFTGGQMQVVYDNWSGTLTYSGASVGPTYSLSAPGAKTLTGQLVPPAAATPPATPASPASLMLTGARTVAGHLRWPFLRAQLPFAGTK